MRVRTTVISFRIRKNTAIFKHYRKPQVSQEAFDFFSILPTVFLSGNFCTDVIQIIPNGRKEDINMFQEIVLLWHKLPN